MICATNGLWDIRGTVIDSTKGIKEKQIEVVEQYLAKAVDGFRM